MNFEKAGVTDHIRKVQKDEQFIERYNTALVDFLRLATNVNESKIRKYSSYLSQLSYYFLTSLSNLQTLGEEYTTIIRFQHLTNNIPTKTVQLLWLVLYVFGKDIFFKIISVLRKKINEDRALRSESKESLVNFLQILKDKESIISKFHTAIFYVQNKYYDIASRVTRIEYVSWMSNEDFRRPFRLLGTVSLVYLTLNIIYDIYANKIQALDESCMSNEGGRSEKECFLCGDEKIYATLLSCGHYFCWSCAFKLVKYTGTCPICRENIDRNSIILLENF